MNEQIKELHSQAIKYCYERMIVDDPYRWYSDQAVDPDKVMEKFAELILRECVQVCADRGKHHDGLYSAWAVDCSERIEKHFGVE